MNSAADKASATSPLGDGESPDALLDAVLRSPHAALRRRLAAKYRFALRIDDIDDVVMIAIERLWAKRSLFDPRKGSVDRWLQRIAANVAANLAHSSWVKARLLERIVESRQLEGLDGSHSIAAEEITGSNSRLVERSLIENALRESLEELSENQRRILLADAQSPDGRAASRELAGELRIPASSVRSHRKRGLEALRAAMARRGFRAAESAAPAFNTGSPQETGRASGTVGRRPKAPSPPSCASGGGVDATDCCITTMEINVDVE